MRDGGVALARETHAAQETEQRRIRIDLGEVCLFNCSGARQLITLLNDLDDSRLRGRSRRCTPAAAEDSGSNRLNLRSAPAQTTDR